jgi:hypothetical protein
MNSKWLRNFCLVLVTSFAIFACDSTFPSTAASTSPSIPVQFTNPEDIIGLPGKEISIAAGQYSVCALAENGTIWCWGHSLARFQSNEISVPVPYTISGIGTNITSVSVGGAHACALMEDNSVVCWGENFLGQLGIGIIDSPRPPTSVISPS